jgi:threonine/homoserine/homoserine lactone efflux protein
VFWQGALTNALNPKVALFFLAFLPQFVDADSSNKPLAFLLLGLLFDINGTIWNLSVAAFAARVGRAVRSSAMSAWINRTLGGLFVYLGVRLALFEMR